MNSQFQMVFKSFEKKHIVSFGKSLIDFRGDEEGKGDFLKFTRKNKQIALTK